jgi:hypothetical protein
MRAENRHETLIKLCLSAAVVMIAVIMATGISFAADSDKVSKHADKKVIKIEKRYKDVKASVKVKIVNPDNMEVKDDDFIKFLTEAYISDKLRIPMESEADLLQMDQNATTEALEKNKSIIQLEKAKRKDSRLVKAAEKRALRKAKRLYKKIWNQPSQEMGLPEDTSGRTKTYMDYKTVTDKSTPQYALLNSERAITKNGFRMYNGYYCVALGSYYGRTIGTKYYITLSNGRTIRCILGDQKKDKHTDKKKHQYAMQNKDIVEFVVDNIDLPGGDVSAVKGFEGSIVSIKRIYETEPIYYHGNRIIPPIIYAENDIEESNDEVIKPEKAKKDNKKSEKNEPDTSLTKNAETEKTEPVPAEDDPEPTDSESADPETEEQDTSDDGSDGT